MAQPPLTRRQAEIIEFLRTYQGEHGISPTLEEMAHNFGVSKVTIFGHVAELERKGVIKRQEPGASRSIQLVKEDSEAIDGVQILGDIAAGCPIEALENPETLHLDSLVPRGRDVYALRVKGNSMIDDAIADGDLVLVERRQDARDGQTVVAVLPGEETTLKRLYREKNGYRLQPANASMDPIHVPDLEVRGVVIGVVRSL
ncbi:MAG: transcriptional repressor LexA [Planctomycetota bacterium]|jgi:repressor LexA|nr:repressor LexA [Planctomycetota bacterium]MDP6838637.1 transcriptional repressor LexA [Planctomycetota bacterium]